ncbi:hypothetical protein [Agrobacterium vitis]|uniref:hypothetical protein n=1 Tax=Agrobacterium vitis TaxID=373 RepID=UPI0012E88743|nr:hypothetical protein [Agrobacterium vitis]MVA37408.1 hypothetical protein [Agrobacterium vitis]
MTSTDAVNWPAVVKSKQKLAEQVGSLKVPSIGTTGSTTSPKDGCIQVGYIVLPSALHKSSTKLAFKAGKMLCENPWRLLLPIVGQQSTWQRRQTYRYQYEPNNVEAMKAIREVRVVAT